MSEKHTLHDVARRAGVGIGTASRVLNNHPNVSEKTRVKVMKVVEELNYRPSFSARQLRTRRSNLIGFVTDEVASTPYAGRIIQGAQEAAWARNYILLIVNSGGERGIIQAAIETFLKRNVEGIIYAAMSHSVVELPESVRTVPVALANCYSAADGFASVVPDEITAGREATMELLQKGHQRVGFINFAYTPGVPATFERLEGYRQALQAYAIPFDPTLVYSGEGDSAIGYQGTLELMRLSNPPTALFCANDRTALGAFLALSKLKLRIPDDVALMGFDNQQDIAMALHPPLSSMALPHYEMGRWAVMEVFRQMQSDALTIAPQQKLHCRVVRRASY